MLFPNFRRQSVVSNRVLVFIAISLFAFSAPAWGGKGLSGADDDHLARAIGLSREEKWEEAISEFQRATSQEPNNSLAWANLGVALGRVDKHKDALLAYEQASKLGYENASFRYNRGLSFAKVNLLEEAATEMKKALDLDPRMAKAEYDLGIVNKLLGRQEEAMANVKNLYFHNVKTAKSLYEQVAPYKIGSVDNGGSLAGQVSLKGETPKPRSFHLVHSPNVEFCSRISDGQGHRILYDFTVSDKGGLKDTVIAILGVQKGKPLADSQKNPAFQIRRCHTDNYAIGVYNGVDIFVENFDPVEHEIATYEIHDPRVFQKTNKQILAKSTQVHSAFLHPNAREYLINCSLHPFLQTRALVVDNPYYTVTDADGRFSIQDIPPGAYDVIAWHPFVPTQKGTITIAPGQEARINFEFDSKEEKRKLYQDDLVGYRFQPWYDNANTFYGTKRVDDPVEILQEPALKYYNIVTPQEKQQSPPSN